MAIVKDKDGVARLKQIVGKRLKQARVAARVSQEEAARVVGKEGPTQISLAESGNRLPPLDSLTKLADLYGVSTDYLLGRIDDPTAEPSELHQSAFAFSVTSTVENCFSAFANVIGDFTAQTAASQRKDRADLTSFMGTVQDLHDALKRFSELNPEFEEDMRGGSRLVNTMARAMDMVERVTGRLNQETSLRNLMQTDDCLEQLAAKRLERAQRASKRDANSESNTQQMPLYA